MATVYETGQWLWGHARSTGNVWIVTDGTTRAIALMFDGKAGKYCLDFATTKQDIINPTSFLYELTPKEQRNLTFTHGAPPQWAIDLYKTVLINPFVNALPQGVIQKVQKALGIDLTTESSNATVTKDEDICPINGYHRFLSYTGLLQSFEWCEFCDKKREVTNVNA